MSPPIWAIPKFPEEIVSIFPFKYIHLMKNLTHASKCCLKIKLALLPAFSICLFFSLNEAVWRVFWQNIKSSIYTEVICLQYIEKTCNTVIILDQIFHTLQYIFFFFLNWELFQYLNHQEPSCLLQNALKNKNKLLPLSVENGIFYLIRIIPD